MNIIKQLQDADGNNIYPIGYVQGGVKMDLLWTNLNPTTNWSGGVHQVLNLSAYDYILIKAWVINDYYSWNLCKVGDRSNITTYIANTGYPIRVRRVTVSTDGILYGDAYYNSTVSNNSCVPVEIYGIKMSYIVPTTVQGLQYIEV